jgi:hypothetical protein
VGSPIQIRPGVVFWPYPTNECPKPHPWIVVSGVVQGSVLLVNLTASENHEESPCHLPAGCHPAITKPSAVNYSEAMEAREKGMRITLGRGVIARHYPDLRPELLACVIDGLRASRDMDPRLKRKYGC